MSCFIIEAAGIKAVAERKNVKYIRIVIKPPDGQVRVSVPRRASLAEVKAFIEEKSGWIAGKQAELRARAAAVPARSDAAVLLWGESLPLSVTTGAERASWNVECGKVVLDLKSDSADERCAAVDALCRGQLAARLPQLAEKWERITGVNAGEWRIRSMKTRWGSCSIGKKRIWLNVRLAMLPQECLEYVIAHELCHLHEPSHNARFKSLMDSFYPGWREIKKQMSEMSAVLYDQ